MIRTAVGFLALLLLLPALQARDKPEKQTPDEQYQALLKEHQTAQQEFQKAYQGAKTQQERNKVFQEKYPRPDKFAPRMLEIAEKNPKDPVALDALVWVVQNVQARGKSDPKSPRTKALKILLRDHVESGKMVGVCPALGRAMDDDSRDLLRAVLEKNKNRSAQAQACLALAQQAENRLQMAQQLKDNPRMAQAYENFLGKEVVDELVKAKPEKLGKDAEVYYERIVKDFANVADERGNKLSSAAEKRLEALRNPILVGKPAPDIIGEDVDGKKFKLSDYRGKVVLLDFWGNW